MRRVSSRALRQSLSAYNPAFKLSPRTLELGLLVLSALPVLLLYAMMVITTTGSSSIQLSISTFAVPLALFGLFTMAHIAIRLLAPAADPAILPIVFVLSGIGLSFLTRLDPQLAVNQTIFLCIAIILMVITLGVVRNLDTLASYTFTIGALGIVMLLIPMLIGTERGGAKLWISVGSFTFQPSELSKVALVLFLAFYLATNREALSATTRRFGPFSIPSPRMLLPLFIMWGLSLVVVIFERDLGSALLFFVFFVVMLYIATGRVSYVVISLILLLIGGVFCYRFFSHVQTRVDIWLDPFTDPSGSGYQLVQALYSIADGGLVGSGIGRGMPTTIPVVTSDFIFAAIAEEMGLLGASAIIALFMLLCVRGFTTAARARSDASAFSAVGLTCALGFQAFLIIGGVTKLLPLTGVTLPFMSQGGSSLLASFMMIGLLLRAGDEATGHGAQMASLVDNGATGASVLSALAASASAASAISRAGAAGSEAPNLESPSAPDSSPKHFLRRFAFTTPESGVLGRVALSKRLTKLMTAFACLFVVLIANMTYLQQINAKTIQDLPINNHSIARSNYNQRGSIISSDGVTLAESVRQDDGSYVRSYPQGLAQHTVGYISTRYGMSGIESSMNETLTGRTELYDWHDVLYSLAGIQTPGSTVALTINSLMQRAVENALEGYQGAIVVLDPETGKVLAKASAPTYQVSDLSTLLTSSTSSELLDRSVQSLYPPGSTFKVLTLAAALDTGVATLDKTYNATSSITFDGAEVTNYANRDYGILTLRDALAVSSNTAYATLGTEIGAQNLVTYARAFGYGRKLGQDFSTAASLMPEPDEMTTWELAWAACGQPVGNHASPAGPQSTVMQNAVLAAAIANGGIVMDPYVVDHVLSASGTVTSTTQPRSLGQAISSQTADQVKEAMLYSVQNGFASQAAVSGVRVAGKTGTAQVNDSVSNSLFIGFAPYDHPTVAISVCIEGSSSSDVEGLAATVAGQVLAQILKIQASGAAQ